MSKRAVAKVASASRACLHEEPMSWPLGRVFGDSTAALTTGERPPCPNITSACDTRHYDLTEGVAGNQPTLRDRRSMDIGM